MRKTKEDVRFGRHQTCSTSAAERSQQSQWIEAMEGHTQGNKVIVDEDSWRNLNCEDRYERNGRRTDNTHMHDDVDKAG